MIHPLIDDKYEVTKAPWLSFAFILISIGRFYSKNTISNPTRQLTTSLKINEQQKNWAQHQKYPIEMIDIHPRDFLYLTTRDYDEQMSIIDRAKPLDFYNSDEINSDMVVHPFLEVDDSGRIKAHEGRHRAAAVLNAGGSKMPMLLMGISSSKRPPIIFGQYTVEHFLPIKTKNPRPKKDLTKFIEDANKGMSDKDLAEAHGLTPLTARVYRLKFAKVVKEGRKPIRIDRASFIADVNAGMTDKELAEKYASTISTMGVYRGKFSDVKRKKGKTIKINRASFIADVNLGMTDAQLAEKYNSTVSTMKVYRGKFSDVKRSKGRQTGSINTKPKVLKTLIPKAPKPPKPPKPVKKQSEREAYRIWKKYERDRGDYE